MPFSIGAFRKKGSYPRLLGALHKSLDRLMVIKHPALSTSITDQIEQDIWIDSRPHTQHNGLRNGHAERSCKVIVSAVSEMRHLLGPAAEEDIVGMGREPDGLFDAAVLLVLRSSKITWI